MTRFFQIVMIFCFISFPLFLGMMTLSKEPQAYSDVEKRVLADRPDVSLTTLSDASFMKKFETYFTDQFYKRIGISTYYYQFQLALHKPMIHNTMVGDNGFLTFLYKTTDATKRAASEAIDEVNNLYRIAEDNEIDLYVVINPSKTNALDHLFESRLSEVSSNQLKTDFLNNIDPAIPVIDNTVYFEEAVSDTEREALFFKTDHHWNYKGGYLAYRHILHTLHQADERIPDALTESTLEIACPSVPNAQFDGTDNRHLLNAVKNPNETTCAHTLPHVENLFEQFYFYDNKDRYSEDLSKLLKVGIDFPVVTYGFMTTGDYSEIFFKPKNPPNDLKVLIVKDSYMNVMVPQIAAHFGETRILDMRHYKDGSVADYALQHDIDLIILAHFEKALYGEAMQYKSNGN